MNLTTTLPVSHTSFAHWHTDDTEVGIVLAKAAFVLSANGTAPQMPPPDLEMVDLFTGDPAHSALLSEQDIAPYKPKTDLIIRGHARSFQNTPRRDWPVNVSIPDRLNYGFHVRGPSQWLKPARKWQLSQPDPVTEVPLTYEFAYGGQCSDGETVHFYEQNPAGKGFMTEAVANDLGSWPAPQIGLLAEFMAASPFEPMAVHGTMPIAKSWLPRRAVAGTFDTAWERDRHPRMPLDYDLGFWNTAPMRLQLDPFLQGDELIEITGVSRNSATVSLQLPGAKLMLQSRSDPHEPLVAMALDTVDLNVDSVDDGHITITLLWRALVPDRDAFTEAEIIQG
jgi:hypothetical protein